MGRLFQDSEDDGLVVKLRGLPWTTTVDDILKFFDNVKVRNGRAGVTITTSRNGRPSGEAFVEVEDEGDLENALGKDKEHLGHRYIEVFKVKRQEMDWMLEHTDVIEGNAFDQGCVRLRGLPFDCSKSDIADFFSGLEIIPNGITIVEDPFNGRATGEAYVQFVDKDTADEGLKKHKEKIGHRYIEIFKSTLKEIRASTHSGGGSNDYVDKMRPNIGGGGFGRPAPYDRNDRFGGANRFGGGGGGFGGQGGRGFGGQGSGSFGSGGGGGFGGQGSGGFGAQGNGGFGSGGGFGGGPMRGGRGGFRGGFNNDRWNEPPSGGFGAQRPGARWSNDQPPVAPSGAHTIHMRGLPFRATDKDIADFFRPVVPVHVNINYENGRPSGEADVNFASHNDAVQAMSKDRTNMQHRYIELFLNSSSSQGGGGGSGQGGRFGGNGSSMFDRRNNSSRGGFRNNFNDY